ncbi:MAG: hypothetical protein ACE5I4_08580, partial [Thermoplasmata archaeon]
MVSLSNGSWKAASSSPQEPKGWNGRRLHGGRGQPTVDIETKATFPTSRDRLWQLLAWHQEEARLREIHP